MRHPACGALWSCAAASGGDDTIHAPFVGRMHDHRGNNYDRRNDDSHIECCFSPQGGRRTPPCATLLSCHSIQTLPALQLKTARFYAMCICRPSRRWQKCRCRRSHQPVSNHPPSALALSHDVKPSTARCHPRHRHLISKHPQPTVIGRGGRGGIQRPAEAQSHVKHMSTHRSTHIST